VGRKFLVLISLFIFNGNKQFLFYLVQNALEFSEISLNLRAEVVNCGSKAVGEIHVAFLKPPGNSFNILQEAFKNSYL
jgi:hypothetical protein